MRKKQYGVRISFFFSFLFFSSLLFFSKPGRPPAAEGGVVIGERRKGGRPRVGWWAKQASEISYSNLERSRFVATMMWRWWFSDKISFDGSTDRGSVQWWWGGDEPVHVAEAMYAVLCGNEDGAAMTFGTLIPATMAWWRCTHSCCGSIGCPNDMRTVLGDNKMNRQKWLVMFVNYEMWNIE